MPFFYPVLNIKQEFQARVVRRLKIKPSKKQSKTCPNGWACLFRLGFCFVTGQDFAPIYNKVQQLPKIGNIPHNRKEKGTNQTNCIPLMSTKEKAREENP